MTLTSDSADETARMRLRQQLAIRSSFSAHAQHHPLPCNSNMSLDLDADEAMEIASPVQPPQPDSLQHPIYHHDHFPQTAFEQPSYEKRPSPHHLLHKPSIQEDFHILFDELLVLRKLAPQHDIDIAEHLHEYLAERQGDNCVDMSSRSQKPAHASSTSYYHHSAQPASPPQQRPPQAQQQQYYYYPSYPQSQQYQQQQPHYYLYPSQPATALQQEQYYYYHYPHTIQLPPPPPPAAQIPPPNNEWVCCGCGSFNEGKHVWCDKCRHFTINCLECFSH